MFRDASFNLQIYQGNDDLYVITVELSDKDGNRYYADLTDNYFKLNIREVNAFRNLAELTTENNCITAGILDSNNNFKKSNDKPYAILIHFTHELTEGLHFPKYLYDLFAIRPDGIHEVILKGELRVLRGVAYGQNSARRY